MPAGPASDVYALGLVLLEALTGSRPFGSRTPHEALAARLVAAPEIPAQIPPAWREVLERMTAIEPNERPDATGLISELGTLPGVTVPVSVPAKPASPLSTAALAGSTGPTRVFEPPVNLTRRRAERKPSRRALVIGAVVAVLLAAGGVGIAAAVGSGGGAGEPALPSLPQPLDQHMDDLWKQVGP